MKIGYVSQWFPPEPAPLSMDIAAGLAERGHDVTVFTGFPNYPSGTLYPGYKQRLGQQETIDGLRVVRAPLFPSHGESVAGRMANYASFAASAAAAVQSAKTDPDIWLSYSSPALAGLPAMLSPRARKKPRALLLQDLWPDSVVESALLPSVLGSVARASLGAVSLATYRDAAAVGIISPGVRPVLESRGVDPRRIHFTPNWADDSNLFPDRQVTSAHKASLGLPVDRRLFMYAGNFGDFQALELLIDGFADVPEACLVLVGDGARHEALTAKVTAERLGNVMFIPRQAADRIGEYIAASDVQIVSLADRPLMRHTMPSKVQTSLAAGRPVLAHAPGDAATVVERAKAGYAAVPGDRKSLAGVIRRYVSATDGEIQTLGRNARSAFLEDYTREAGLDRLEAMLGHALEGEEDTR